jgi:hypothetical protein
MVTTVTTPTRSAAPARPGRTVGLLVAGAVVAGVATTVIALTAQAVGAGDFPPLKPLVYLPFVVLGIAAATAGWAIVRARATDAGRLLRVLVPVLTVLSLVPDVVLAVTEFIPGTTLTGAVALGLMHLTVVGVAVPVLARALPVGSAR